MSNWSTPTSTSARSTRRRSSRWNWKSRSAAVSVPATKTRSPTRPSASIAIDSLFSPVTRVRYAVENARVGQRTDYDRLLLEIWTDGRISPDDALTQASAILQHHLDVFVGYDKNAVEFEEVVDKQDEEKTKLKKLLNMSVNEIELSVRAANCLNNANITTVGQLAMKTEQEMLKYRNFGKKSLNEIKDKLAALGLSLGMTFEPDLLEAPKEDTTASSPDNRSFMRHLKRTAKLGRTGRASQRDARQPGLQPHQTQARHHHAGQSQSRPLRGREDGHARQTRHHSRPPPGCRPACTRKTPSRSSSTKSPPPRKNAAAVTRASSASTRDKAMPHTAPFWNGLTRPCFRRPLSKLRMRLNRLLSRRKRPPPKTSKGRKILVRRPHPHVEGNQWGRGRLTRTSPGSDVEHLAVHEENRCLPVPSWADAFLQTFSNTTARLSARLAAPRILSVSL